MPFNVTYQNDLKDNTIANNDEIENNIIPTINQLQEELKEDDEHNIDSDSNNYCVKFTNIQSNNDVLDCFATNPLKFYELL